MWIISYIWNNKTHQESYNSHSTAITRLYKLKDEGKDPSIHFKD